MTALLSALGRERGVIALAGAGGKTTLMLGLAREAHARGLRVIVTTTTHIGVPVGQGAVFFDEDADAAAGLAAALERDRRAVLLGQRGRDDKAAGLTAARVDALAGLADLILVEADGARRRSFKMPADHEAVVPASSGGLVVVAGLDVLGRPLDEAHVHRWERVAAAAGQPIGSAVTEDTIVRALLDPGGYLSRVPVGAEAVVFLNKAEGEAAPAGERIGARLAAGYGRVLAGSARDGIARRVSVEGQA